jgi:RHS repeat-associated protein
VSDNGTQIFDTNYTFINPDGTHTSNLVQTVENKKHSGGGYDKTLTYQYDSNSNITSIGDGTNTTTYAYDNANQLTRENNYAAGKTWTWVYDAGGNIRQKNEYTYTTGTLGTPTSTITYSYNDANGWGDLLTSYNGSTITYDGLGNPTNDGTMKYVWEGGRNLIQLTDENNNPYATYTYNKDGIRTSKTVNGVTTTYTLVDDRVTQETDGTNNIYYRYDTNNNLISMNLNGTEYYYFFNSQGDVMGLVDDNGNVVVEYTYDAWGNILSTTGSLASTVGVENPYRYRGYRYDAESGLYYLESRYYSSSWGRYISSDTVVEDTGNPITNSLYAYCLNNPINLEDPHGYIGGLDDLLEAGGAGLFLLGGMTVVLVTAIAVNHKSIGLALSDAGNWASSTVTNIANSISSGTISAWNWTKKAASDAWNWTSNTVTNAWNSLTNLFAQHGKRNVRDTELRGMSTEDLKRMYNDPHTSSAMRKRIIAELKGRGAYGKKTH